MLKTLVDPVVRGNYERRRFFLSALGEMNSLDCEILAYLFKKTDGIVVGSWDEPGLDPYEVVGAVGRLKSFGFLKSDIGGFTLGPGVDNQLNEIVSLSEFGKAFCEFCLEDARDELGGPGQK